MDPRSVHATGLTRIWRQLSARVQHRGAAGHPASGEPAQGVWCAGDSDDVDEPTHVSMWEMWGVYVSLLC